MVKMMVGEWESIYITVVVCVPDILSSHHRSWNQRNESMTWSMCRLSQGQRHHSCFCKHRMMILQCSCNLTCSRCFSLLTEIGVGLTCGLNMHRVFHKFGGNLAYNKHSWCLWLMIKSPEGNCSLSGREMWICKEDVPLQSSSPGQGRLSL